MLVNTMNLVTLTSPLINIIVNRKSRLFSVEHFCAADLPLLSSLFAPSFLRALVIILPTKQESLKKKIPPVPFFTTETYVLRSLACSLFHNKKRGPSRLQEGFLGLHLHHF